MKTEHFHNTPKEVYDRLCVLYGQQVVVNEKEGRTTRYVQFGAGSSTLTFFAPREEKK